MIIEYDGSLEGFFTLVHYTFTQKPPDFQICRVRGFSGEKDQDSNQGDLFTGHEGEHLFLPSDKEKAHEVLGGLEKKYTKEVLNLIIRALLSEQWGIEEELLKYIVIAASMGPGIINHLTDPTVSVIDKAAQRVMKEYHRYLGIIRFRELTDGTYYAPIRPDTNIIPLLSPHFMDRFPGQSWVIHDIDRRSALFYDQKSIEMVEISSFPDDEDDIYSEEEKFIQGFWQGYYKAIGVKERKNLKLRQSFLPKKTWEFLPELMGRGD